MISRRLLRRVRIARLDRGEDCRVLPMRRFRPPWRGKGRPAQQGERVAQGLEGLHQVAVVGARVDRLVELAVEDRQGLGLAASRLGAGEQSVHKVDLGLAHVASREAGGRAFQDRAHGIEFRHLPAVELGHHHAAPRHEGEPAFRLQPPKGFAHRRRADGEPVGDLGLAQALARPVTPGMDGLADPLLDERRE